MVGKAGSGRKPGFKHSEETRQKMRAAHKGSSQTEETREKISRAKAMYDLDGKCAKRYDALCAQYPEEQEFFEENVAELIFAMQDVLTDKELSDIRRFHETVTLHADTPYQYTSTSCFAAEDVMIELIDRKRAFERQMSQN